jgi:hypothetical protein
MQTPNEQNTIKDKIDKLEISFERKGMITDLVEAETFNLRRFSFKGFIIFEKYKNLDPSDKRVWVKAIISLPIEELGLFTLRPFIDKQTTLSIEDGRYMFTKTYFAGEEDIE